MSVDVKKKIQQHHLHCLPRECFEISKHIKFESICQNWIWRFGTELQGRQQDWLIVDIVGQKKLKFGSIRQLRFLPWECFESSEQINIDSSCKDWTSSFLHWKCKMPCYKTSCLNEEVNCIVPSPLVSVPCTIYQVKQTKNRFLLPKLQPTRVQYFIPVNSCNIQMFIVS